MTPDTDILPAGTRFLAPYAWIWRGFSRADLRWLAGLTVLAVLLRLAVLWVLAAPYGGLGEGMCHFDCGWYERIALDGYGSDTNWGDRGSLPNWVFFPLYPALLRAVSEVMPARLGGILLSAACLVGFILVGLAYLRLSRRAVASLTWIGVVVLFPTGLFFTALYTEALFALLSTACLLALGTRRPWLAAVAAGLASATRPTGVLLAPLILWDRAMALRAVWPVRPARAIAILAPVAIAPLGLVLFSLWQAIAVGDPLAFSHQQVWWHRTWVGPFATISGGLVAGDLGNLFDLPSQTWSALWALTGLAVAGAQAWRGRFAEAWLLAACILLPAATGLDALPRYVGTNPVFLFALHDLLAGGRWRTAIACAFFAAGSVLIAQVWMGGAGGFF
jgi:hypothetical protein